VTHTPEFARPFLPTADPGTTRALLPCRVQEPDDSLALLTSPLLRDLPAHWLGVLLHEAEPAEPPETMDDDAWLVVRGRPEISRGGEPPIYLRRGDLVHRSIMGPGRQRLTVIDPWARLLRLPGALFRSLVAETGLSRRLRSLYGTRHWWYSIAGEELELDTLVALAQASRTRRYDAGSPIVIQGEPAGGFYVLTAGSVEVVCANGARTARVGPFSPGYHFGEIALLRGEPRTATVRALEPARVLELSGGAFRRHLLSLPLARYQLGASAALRQDELQRLMHA
jgi:CRP-like cAMP-binding protein